MHRLLLQRLVCTNGPRWAGGARTSSSHVVSTSRRSGTSWHRRRFCTSKDGIAKEAAEEEGGMSLAKRFAIFGGVTLVGGFGTFCYMLTTDEEFVVTVHDFSPELVSLVAPYLGLPVVGETGVFDVEMLPPNKITALVGENVPISAVLRSGAVCVVESSAKASRAEIEEAVKEKLGVASLDLDPVVDIVILDEEEFVEMQQKGPEELQEAFGLKIPSIPEGATKQELQHLMQLLRMREMDMKTTLALAEQSGQDKNQALRGLERIEERKKSVKLLIKGM